MDIISNDIIHILRNISLDEKIFLEISCRIIAGGTSWEGFIMKDTMKIISKFRESGFTVSQSKSTPLLVKISWGKLF